MKNRTDDTTMKEEVNEDLFSIVAAVGDGVFLTLHLGSALKKDT